MAINKVVYGDQTLVDLTSDTVSPDKLLSGETAHDRSGNQISGSVVVQNYTAGDGIDISANNEISVDTTFTEASTRTNISSGDTLATIWGKIKKFFSDLKTVAFTGSYNDLSNKPTIPSAQVNSDWNASSGVAQILNKPSLATVATSGSYNDLSNKPTIPDISTKVSKSGDTMTGLLNLNTTNNVALNFRPNNNDYSTTISYQTSGNEACVFATKNAVTSFMFINGEDSITNHADSRWQSLTPALQIKNNRVSIGARINSGATPSHQLEVYGSVSSLFQNTSTDTPIFLNGNASGSYICYRKNDGTVFGYIGVNSSKKPVFYDSSAKEILTTDTGLRLSGGNMSGKIYTSATRLLQWTTSDSDNNPDGTSWYGLGRFRASGESGDRVCLANYWGLSFRASAAGNIRANGYEILTTNTGLAKSGGTMTGNIQFASGGALFYGTGATSSATAFVKGSGYLNLCSPGIQCRNWADNGWAGITGTSFTPQNNSSRKIKENIKPITEEEATKLLDVNVVSFDYKQGAGFGDGDERKGKFGVIAEEINEVIPSVVSYQINEDHTVDYSIPSGVSYDKFVPHLIKLVQMQQKEIDDLKKQVNYLFNQNNT